MGKIKLLFMIESMKAGGAERQLHELMTGLNPQEFDVRLITWIDNPHFLGAETPYPHQCYPRKSKFDIQPIREASRLLKREEVHMVHGFLDTGNLYAAIARRWAGKGMAIASERSSRRKLGLWQRWHKPWSHRQVSMTICNSREGQKFIQTLGVPQSRIMVIVNGVNSQIFRPLPPEEIPALKQRLGFKGNRRYMICAGRIAPVKNQKAIVQAFGASTIKEHFDLLLIGESSEEYRQIVLGEVEKLDLQSQVSIIPSVKNIQEYYQMSDLLVLFSVREGTPNALLEAMASGIPAVVSDVGDCPNYIQDGVNGWVVPVRDTTKLTQTFDDIKLMNGSRLRTMGKAAKKSIFDLGMDKVSMIRRFSQAYKTLYQGMGL